MRHPRVSPPFYYGWLILLAGIGGYAAAGGATFWAVSLYVPAVADDLEVERFPIVLVFMVGQVISSLLNPFVGRWIDRNGARNVLLVGSIAGAATLLLASRSTTVWQLMVTWSLVGVARSFLFPVPYNWLLTRWFDARRQTALGVITVGFGLGGAVLLPVLSAIETRWDWHAAMAASAAAMLLFNGLGAWLLVADRPADLGMTIEPPAPGSRGAGEEEGGLSLAEALRTPVFYLLSGGLMLLLVGQGSVTTLAVDYFESRAVAGAATIVAVGALLRGFLRLPLGLLIGRVRRVWGLATGVALSQVAAIGVLVAWVDTPGIAVYLALWGTGGAFVPMLEPILVSHAFGVRHFGAVSGMSSLVTFAGQVVGPLGGALLYDATGSYVLAFTLYVVATALAAVLLLAAGVLVARPAHRARQQRAGMPVADERPAD